jgi:hypothetical protein
MGLPLWPKDGAINAAGTSRFPPNPFAITRIGSEIDLRAEMKLMLEGNEYYPRRGHWVLLRRMDKRQRCFCWNEKPIGDDKFNEDKGKYNEPKLRCAVCNGEGYVYEDELQLARRMLVSPAIGLAASETMSDIGWMNINYIVFYMQYFVNPEKGDKIIEIDLNADDATPIRPYVKKEMYRIAVAEPFRDQQGRIEFWRVAAKLEIV